MKNKKNKKSRKNFEKLQFADAILVSWRDTTGHEGWLSLHDGPLPEPVIVDQLGWFISLDADTLHITQGRPRGAECQTMGISAIPMGTVIELKKVKV